MLHSAELRERPPGGGMHAVIFILKVGVAEQRDDLWIAGGGQPPDRPAAYLWLCVVELFGQVVPVRLRHALFRRRICENDILIIRSFCVAENVT